jgi:hypothetical protein
MTSMRKKRLTLTLAASKPRNPLVAPALQRKAGAHTPAKARDRQDARAQIRQALRDTSQPGTPGHKQRQPKDTE